MNEGAKKARAIIKAFHHCLNSASLLPSQTYMPANRGFPAVLVINQIVALFLSHNYELIPAQVRMAYDRFVDFDTKPVFSSYKSIAFDYLCQVSYFLGEHTNLDRNELERTIPNEIWIAGPKEAPSYDIERQEFRPAV